MSAVGLDTGRCLACQRNPAPGEPALVLTGPDMCQEGSWKVLFTSHLERLLDVLNGMMRETVPLDLVCPASCLSAVRRRSDQGHERLDVLQLLG